MTREFDLLTQEQQEQLLYVCAWLSWRDITSNIIHSNAQLQAALTYGANYQINAQDYAAVETVFPTQGEPQPPKK